MAFHPRPGGSSDPRALAAFIYFRLVCEEAGGGRRVKKRLNTGHGARAPSPTRLLRNPVPGNGLAEGTVAAGFHSPVSKRRQEKKSFFIFVVISLPGFFFFPASTEDVVAVSCHSAWGLVN